MVQETKNRDISIDFLRAVAIILMVFSHTNTILGIRFFIINQKLQEFANSICFVVFLLCFSISGYYSLYNKNKSIAYLLRRLGIIYISYLIVSLLVLLDSHSLTYSNNISSQNN